MYTNMEQLRQACLSCTACPLSEGRSNVVFGTGNPCSQVMLVGEGPGEQEDRTGLPFVGPAGKLLDLMLDIIGLDRNRNVYIANIVKCRPPGNRDPRPEEQDACIGFLRNQVLLIKPKIIVCLGRIAGARIIGPDFKISRDHGVWYERKGYLITSTYHPSALLRDPSKKDEAFDDILKIGEKIREVCDEKLYG